VQNLSGAKVEGIKILREILENPTKSDLEVARGISIIEECGILHSTLESMQANSLCNTVKKIGITGAPGVGKSTFLNMLLNSQNLNSFKIAVIAVDPSSRFTNGAVLGDRIRMTQSSAFEKVYFRSMATRGAYGGLTESIQSVLCFLGLCGFTLIFVETVGIGQNEVEVANCVDSVVHILDSNSGDEVQLEKAGIMEVGNIYFVNTKDNNLNTKYISSLRSLASNSNRKNEMKPVVIVGSAINGEGFDEVAHCLSLIDLNLLDKGSI
jgi:LAO/AO transport system kinase